MNGALNALINADPRINKKNKVTSMKDSEPILKIWGANNDKIIDTGIKTATRPQTPKNAVLYVIFASSRFPFCKSIERKRDIAAFIASRIKIT